MEKVDHLLEEAKKMIDTSYDKGKELLRQAYVMSVEVGYDHGKSWALMRMGSYELRVGKRYKAIEYYKKSLSMMKALDDLTGVCRCHFAMGTVYAMIADFELALTHFEKAKDLSLKYDKTYYHKLISNIAETYLNLQQYQSAIRMSNHVIDYMKRQNIERLFVPYSTIGNAYLQMGKFRDGLQVAEKALGYLEDHENASYRSTINMIIAGAYKGLKYHDEALIVYNRALKLGISAGDLQNASKINRQIAEIYFIKKEFDYTFRHLQEAMTLSLKHRSKQDESDVYYTYAKVYESLGDYKKAFDYHKKATDLMNAIRNERIIFKYNNIERSDIEIKTIPVSHELVLDKTLGELRTTYLNLSLSEKSELTDAFVEAIVDTIDMRDTTTSGHSKRIARYCLEMMRQINEDKRVYKDISFSDSEMKEMYYAALLHDIGKLAIKESVLLKHQRLTHDRLEAIHHKKVYIKTCLKIRSDQEELSDDELDMLMHIDDYMAFIRQCNAKAAIDDLAIKKLEHIHKLQVNDCYNNEIELLNDYEYNHLIVKKGNLVSDEWEHIKQHAQKTKEVLEIIPWMKGIKNVPYLASSHHEKLDGSGYPLGLQADEITLPMRILSIVDIFEALTASDRPYKPPLSIDAAIDILKSEAQNGKLDGELINYFVENEICYLCKDELEE